MQSKVVNHLVCAFLRRCVRQMQKLGLTQTELAKRMKVSRPYVTKLLTGDVNITFGSALRLAHALEMDFRPELKEKHPNVVSKMTQNADMLKPHHFNPTTGVRPFKSIR